MFKLMSLRIAIVALRLNTLRSVLSMLGISIGVGAVITMLAIGSGAQTQVEAQFQTLGTNVIIVYPGSATASGVRLGGGSRASITDDDAAAIQHELGDVEAVAPVLQGRGQTVHAGRNWATAYYGVTPDYFEVRNWVIESGDAFGREDVANANKVVLLGQTVARNLFSDSDPVGQIIRVGKVPMLVLGVLKAKGQTQTAHDVDDMIIMPLSTLRQRVVGGSRAKLRLLNSISLRVRQGANMGHVETEIGALLRERHRLQLDRIDDFTVHNPTEVLNARRKSAQVLSVLLATVAAIALLTGGVGIMNIMLVSVTERTREIGLRMAVGARASDILWQFLTEAVILSVMGGFGGILLGVAVSYAMAYLGEWHLDLNASAILLALASATATGVFFGVYPASKASHLSPVEALRYE
jgi:putative ABC transport system permease protein